MGTRSLTVVNDERDKEIVVMYRQYDGYPTGHGTDLKKFLLPLTIVNGLGLKEERKIANGMECLAAQIVAHFKTDPGGIYLFPSKTRDCGEEWIYTVYKTKDGQIGLKVQGGAVTFFGMPGTKQIHMPAVYNGPVADFDPDAATELYSSQYDKIRNDFLEKQERKKAKAAKTKTQLS